MKPKNGRLTLPINKLSEKLHSFPPVKLKQSSPQLLNLLDRILPRPLRQRFASIPQPPQLMTVRRMITASCPGLLIRSPRPIPNRELGRAEQRIRDEVRQVVLDIRTAAKTDGSATATFVPTEIKGIDGTHSRFRCPGLRFDKNRMSIPSSTSSGRFATGSARLRSKLCCEISIGGQCGTKCTGMQDSP